MTVTRRSLIVGAAAAAGLAGAPGLIRAQERFAVKVANFVGPRHAGARGAGLAEGAGRTPCGDLAQPVGRYMTPVAPVAPRRPRCDHPQRNALAARATLQGRAP